MLEGAEVLLLCSNNYLGLADHPRVRRAAADAAERYGAGAGASRLISGDMELHRLLEKRLSAFKRTESALLFGSGYLANLGVVARVADDGVARAEQGADRAGVGQVARGEDERVLGAHEVGELALEL